MSNSSFRKRQSSLDKGLLEIKVFEEIDLHFKDWDREIESGTDRGVIICGGSFLDYILRENIFDFLFKSSVSELLLEPEQPLGSFGARINLSYCLGLITMGEKDNLDYIRKIRNLSGHKLGHAASFGSEKVKDLCEKLSIPPKMYMPRKLQYGKHNYKCFSSDPLEDNNSHRKKFIFTVTYLINILKIRPIIFASKTKELKILPPAAEQLRTVANRFLSLRKESNKLEDKLKRISARAEKLGIKAEAQKQTTATISDEELKNIEKHLIPEINEIAKIVEESHKK